MPLFCLPLSMDTCYPLEYSLCKLALPAGEAVLEAAAAHIHMILPQFNQQNLALTLWSFAKLGWRPPLPVLDAACRCIAPCSTSLAVGYLPYPGCAQARPTMHLAQHSWLIAVTGSCQQHLHPTPYCCRHAMTSLDSSSPQNLSNLVWSLATMQCAAPTLLLQVRDLWRCPAAKPDSLSLLLSCSCAAAKAGCSANIPSCCRWLPRALQ